MWFGCQFFLVLSLLLVVVYPLSFVWQNSDLGIFMGFCCIFLDISIFFIHIWESPFSYFCTWKVLFFISAFWVHLYYKIKRKTLFNKSKETNYSIHPFLPFYFTIGSRTYITSFYLFVQLGGIKLILTQRKDGNNLLMPLSKQFQIRRKELFFSFGETQLKKNPGISIFRLNTLWNTLVERNCV